MKLRLAPVLGGQFLDQTVNVALAPRAGFRPQLDRRREFAVLDALIPGAAADGHARQNYVQAQEFFGRCREGGWCSCCGHEGFFVSQFEKTSQQSTIAPERIVGLRWSVLEESAALL